MKIPPQEPRRAISPSELETCEPGDYVLADTTAPRRAEQYDVCWAVMRKGTYTGRILAFVLTLERLPHGMLESRWRADGKAVVLMEEFEVDPEAGISGGDAATAS